MKKTFCLSAVVALFVIFTVLFSGICAGAAETYSYVGDAVYLSDNGSDANDGKTPETAVATFAKAEKLGSFIVIVDSYTTKDMTRLSAERLVGLTSESKLNSGVWALCFGSDITIDNLEICALQPYSYILAYGNSLTIGGNVRSGGEGFGIRGGGEGTYIGKDTNIVIKGGVWKDVHGGTRNAPVNGSTFITVYEGAQVARLNVGNNASREGDKISDNGCIRLVGNPKIGAVNEKPENLLGEMCLELSEYTGEIKEEWFSLGARITTEKRDIPEYVAEHFKEVSGEYDLTVIKGNVRFISDSGAAENDGLTKDTPMNDLSLAVKSMGDEGGTVIVTGTYTHDSFNPDLPPFDLTSACADDKFVHSVWSLHTNNTEIYNLNIVIAKSGGFILHCGKPLVIGENVRMSFTGGVTSPLGIRGNEFGDVELCDIRIKSGTWATVYTGTKNANILGNSTVTVEGGSIGTIAVGNDSASGRILGNTTVILKGKPAVSAISDRAQCDGYTIVDICELEGAVPTIPETLEIVNDKNERLVPINKKAAFINGYPDGTFLPEAYMTRAEAVSVVSKIAGYNSFVDIPDTTAFSDVSDADWYSRNVRYLESLGMLGFFGDRFEASKGITRGEFVKLISKMVRETEGEAPKFTDVSLAHPFLCEIILCAKSGLVNGYPDSTFRPDNGLKRCEIVTVLSRLTERNPIAENLGRNAKFSDLSGHWAEFTVAAAASEAYENDVLMWYTGEEIGANTKVDKSLLDTRLTTAILEGLDSSDGNTVLAASDKYAKTRREEILGFESDVTVTGTKYYVSADGDDGADGKTPETAWKTLAKVSGAELAAGDGVFLRRGDVFREQLVTKAGVTYSAYGVGEKPAIYGSERNYAGSDFWQKTERANIYVSKDSFAEDVGLIVFDGGKAWSDKCVIDRKGFDGSLDKLTTDLQMYHSTSDKKLYLYSVSDPNTRFASCEIARGVKGVTGEGSGVTLDNLSVKYVGIHGIGYGGGTTGLTVQNCELGWIGGKIQYGSLRYGNAIEIYGGCRDFTVKDCYIYQVYDAGVTHQYFNTDADRAAAPDYVAVMENVKYTGNLIEYCSYNIEYVNALPKERGIMKNVEISHNLLLHGGEGWGMQRPDRREAVIKGWSEENNAENNVFFDNVLATSTPYCSLVHIGSESVKSLPEFFGNLFIAKPGTAFGIYGSKESSSIRLTENIEDITVGLSDNTFVFVK